MIQSSNDWNCAGRWKYLLKLSWKSAFFASFNKTCLWICAGSDSAPAAALQSVWESPEGRRAGQQVGGWKSLLPFTNIIYAAHSALGVFFWLLFFPLHIFCPLCCFTRFFNLTHHILSTTSFYWRIVGSLKICSVVLCWHNTGSSRQFRKLLLMIGWVAKQRFLRKWSQRTRTEWKSC